MTNIDKLLPNISFEKKPGDSNNSESTNLEEVEAYGALPNQDETSLATGIINNVLNFTSVIIIVSIIVTAAYYLVSRGKPEQTDKAKQILINLGIGIVIISVAYGVITGISKINFFPT